MSASEHLAEVRRPDASAEAVRSSLAQLLRVDAALGRATALDMLASEPRIKPSRALVIDPGDKARLRWTHRVAAGAALLASSSAADLFEELAAELSDDPDLTADVLSLAAPHPGLSAEQRDVLARLAGR